MNRPQNRNLRPNPKALGVEPLREGESSGAYRVRGPRDALDWFGTLSASERGQLVANMRAFIADPSTPPTLAASTARHADTIEALGDESDRAMLAISAPAVVIAETFADELPARRRGDGPKLSRAQLDVLRALADGGRYVAHGSGRIVHQDGTETRLRQSATGLTLKRLGLIDEDGHLTPKGGEVLARG